MSSTNRGAERVEHDAYFTPDSVAKACVSTLPIHADETAWEPHAGGGAFVRALAHRARVVYVSDLVARSFTLDNGIGILAQKRNALDGWDLSIGYRPDWIVGNPPFSEAQDHVEMAIANAGRGVGFLLRLAFLEGQKRAAFWRAHPCASVHVLSKRPSFTGGGTDSAAYGFFRWMKEHSGPTTLHHL